MSSVPQPVTRSSRHYVFLVCRRAIEEFICSCLHPMTFPCTYAPLVVISELHEYSGRRSRRPFVGDVLHRCRFGRLPSVRWCHYLRRRKVFQWRLVFGTRKLCVVGQQELPPLLREPMYTPAVIERRRMSARTRAQADVAASGRTLLDHSGCRLSTRFRF